MAGRQSRLEAERLAIIQKSMSRGRSPSPNQSNPNSRSASPSNDAKGELKWSIINHDPSERLVKLTSNDGDNDVVPLDFDDEQSEEEHLSDDDDQEKFQYDDTGNILPNFACRDEKIHEISHILENSNLSDTSTIKKLEELTASERAFANAKKAGKPIDEEALEKLKNEKNQLLGGAVDLDKSDQDFASRRQKLEDYSSYRRKIIDHENEKFKQSNSPIAEPVAVDDDKDFMIPYTSAIEDKLDSEFASKLNETIIEGKVDSSRPQSRVIQTITRGNFFQLIDPKVKPKMFLLCMDFSPESIFALEWSLGTVLVDGSVLFIVYVIEENDANHHLKGNTNSESARESHRLDMLNKAKQQVLNLLKLTKLQIHIVIEITHHPIPRHLILEFIDHLQPTLVIVGSRGQSAIKGVLLGSLSNYLVTKSTVPVMVVREKLKKINRFKNGSSVFSNNIKPLTLSEARID
ncbi:hypothetical protein PSN45_000845 [Yamadazyma tenuis]|uniref:Adenine nucleotide alpha hydrolases-like protein n=1 Tax=Candida tenuis (strain ATCC 10573 / BCRC 21748 / CBS 615 / JCM 9827 / NBRC 10315 / NRRL Y-1498 / VKM Y-70) TaxID=590646 RepID=G3BB28_CANTC|nr:adenine nucleotide alpha hydrolases-like protein [Yamadazyma tenuis ATCC 10573]XP_006688959.1 uncharacterized protein CANTEDRAFT_115591 [Yamadazyma tenuis ATCC 10573]EGV62788.1 adenine nucleotide alpha hydrolases-like protein [Yamadazyma tenuis ATCC 10573]EGV62789.1 hypothetical protein CANTEDRAFT_115591 [Yamadazyma tenuis ATCC 10573]WEJ93382.1 hypothetical protein PSN45_000845 [Yamadazyma tenuis]